MDLDFFSFVTLSIFLFVGLLLPYCERSGGKGETELLFGKHYKMLLVILDDYFKGLFIFSLF